jgi:pyrroline-5-carboxylate reductase
MCIKVDESHLDPITATSGSGPAFVAYFAQAMIEEAILQGLSEEDAELLIAQTLIGTGTLMKSGWTTRKIIETVASPGGTTEAGLKMLDDNGANRAIHHAIKFATAKAKELGK